MTPPPRRPATAHRQHDRLDQELHGNMPALGAQRPADADLPRPLGHGGQHDVHNADAADQQRDGGNGSQHDVEDALGLLRLTQELQGHNRLVIGLPVETAQQGFDLRVRRFDGRTSCIWTVIWCSSTFSTSRLPAVRRTITSPNRDSAALR